MKILTTILFLFFVTLADAQSVQWAKKGGGIGIDEGKNITVDAQGNSYVVGNFQYAITFGTYTLTAVSQNTFIAKYDALGNIKWLRQIPGYGNYPGAIVYCPAANCIYVAGTFVGTISPGSYTLTTYGSTDCFFARYDLNGNCVWAVKAGSVTADAVEDVDCDLSGNLIATGLTQTGGIFGGFTVSFSSFTQAFTTSISPAGNFQWLTISCRTSAGTVAPPIPSVKTDISGNIYVTGVYTGTCIFGSQTFTAVGGPSNFNVFLQKMSPAGTILWTVSIGGTGNSESRAIATDNSGNVFITGGFYNTVDFGGISKTSLGAADIYVAKYCTAGSLLWVQQFGSIYSDWGRSIELLPNGNIVLAGFFVTATSIGSFNLTSNGSNDAYVAFLNTSGNPYWVQSFGGTMVDMFFCAVPDNNMNIYCTGSFNGTAYYGGIPLIASGNSDVSVVKIAASGPLPLQSLSFTVDADFKNDDVECKWTTASETNNDFFTLEKSCDGKTFKTVAHLKGMISNSSYHNYNFTDEHPYNGISYYRLSQTDLNGTHENLKTVTVNFKNKNSFAVHCYPTIGNGQINIDANKLLSEIKVFDLNGNLIRDIFHTSSFMHLNLTDLKKGIYFIQCIANDEIDSHKIIIQ